MRMMQWQFHDRTDAGRQLAARLGKYAGRPDVVVLALPRGGVPVAFEVASALGAPLDVLVVRKLGVPGQEELAMGAIASGGTRAMNDDVLRTLVIDAATIERVAARARAELERREHAYRGDREPVAVEGRTVILVDDGIATGATVRAAVRALRQRHPARVVIATPVAAPESIALLRPEADEIVCLATPYPMLAIGIWYRDFGQTTDEEVVRLLERSREGRPCGAGCDEPP